MKNILSVLMIVFLSISSIQAQNIKGTCAIKNVQTGMLLRIKDANNANGTPLVAYTPTNWKCMTWDFKHIEGNTYELKNLLTGKTMQPANKLAKEGSALEEQPIDNSAIQQYEFIPAEKNTYFIKLKGTELYVTPSDEKGTINSNILLFNIIPSKKNGTKLQQWTIYEQHPEI